MVVHMYISKSLELITGTHEWQKLIHIADHR